MKCVSLSNSILYPYMLLLKKYSLHVMTTFYSATSKSAFCDTKQFCMGNSLVDPFERVTFERGSLQRGHFRERVTLERWSLQREGNFREMVTLERSLQREVTLERGYFRERWSLQGDGHCRERATVERWSLQGDGHCREMVTVGKQSLQGEGLCREVVTVGRCSL